MCDGKSVRGLSASELGEQMLGDEGSWLMLGLQRTDAQVFFFFFVIALKPRVE